MPLGASTADDQPGGNGGGWEFEAAGPRGTLRKSFESDCEFERGVLCQWGFSGRWRVFVICLGPILVEFVVVSVLFGLESVEASSLVGDLESVVAEVFGRLDIRKPISSLSHSARSYDQYYRLWGVRLWPVP